VISLGLSSAEQSALHNTMVRSHSIAVTVQILTLSGHHLADLSGKLLDGQVNIDAWGTVTRSCTLSLLDPDRSMSFDTDSPNESALYLDRMIRILYSVKVPDLQRWIPVPVFTGPVVKMSRADDVISVEAQGKEVLAMGVASKATTFKRGANKVGVISLLLSDFTGEDRFDFIESSQYLTRDLSVTPRSIPWDLARGVAHSMGLQLFYDGRGTARLRPFPATVLYRFRTGDFGNVMTSPQITYTMDELKNCVTVIGQPTKMGLTVAPLTYVANPPVNHPLSPWRLGRNGVPRFLRDVIEDTSITSVAEARILAEATLLRHLTQAVDVTFDSLPVPHLEPGDVCQLTTPEFSNTFRVGRLSLPLTSGGQMSMGYLNRVGVKRRGRR
jgi:hypothetical protein